MTHYAGPDFARSCHAVRKNTIQIAQETPENQYGVKPTADCHSVGEAFAHEMHHRGQLMLIERMLGIVPRLTRARQARAAAS